MREEKRTNINAFRKRLLFYLRLRLNEREICSFDHHVGVEFVSCTTVQNRRYSLGYFTSIFHRLLRCKSSCKEKFVRIKKIVRKLALALTRN